MVVGLEVTPIEDLGLGAASGLFFFFFVLGRSVLCRDERVEDLGMNWR